VAMAPPKAGGNAATGRPQAIKWIKAKELSPPPPPTDWCGW